MTPGEVLALNEEFAIEYTYNSNAMEGNTLTLRETDMVFRGLTIDKKPLRIILMLSDIKKLLTMFWTQSRKRHF